MIAYKESRPQSRNPKISPIHLSMKTLCLILSHAKSPSNPHSQTQTVKTISPYANIPDAIPSQAMQRPKNTSQKKKKSTDRKSSVTKRPAVIIKVIMIQVIQELVSGKK